MKLRDSFHFLIHYNVGTGDNIFTLYDNWHDQVPLVKIFGDKLIYDLVSSISSKLRDFITNGAWSLPHPIYVDLQIITHSFPHSCKENKIEWGHNGGTKYTVAAVKEALRERGPIVDWAGMVCFKGFALKFAVIEWLAFKGRLLTKDN